MEKLRIKESLRLFVVDLVKREFNGDLKRMICEYHEAVEMPFDKFPDNLSVDRLEWSRDVYCSDHGGYLDAARREFANLYLDFLKALVDYKKDGNVTDGYARDIEYATALAYFSVFCLQMQRKARLTRILGLEEFSRKVMPRRTGLGFEEMGEIGKELNRLVSA